MILPVDLVMFLDPMSSQNMCHVCSVHMRKPTVPRKMPWTHFTKRTHLSLIFKTLRDDMHL